MKKIKKTTRLLFFFILTIFRFINLDAQNLLINGSFEAQSISSPIFSYPATNPSAISGWTTINDGNMGCNIALFGTGMGLGIYQGFNSVDLQNGSNDTGNAGCDRTPTTGGAIQQTVTLTIGLTYKLKFASNGGNGGPYMSVRLNGTNIKTMTANPSWKLDSVNFVASVVSNTIQFRNEQNVSAVTGLDAVSLEIVTEICNNGFDDDGDGLIDCADPGCALATNCSFCGSSSHTTNWQWLTPESGYNRALAIKYTGADQHFTVPEGVTSVKVKAWGAGGGGPFGGSGGFISGILATTPGEFLTLIVGQGGQGQAAGSGPILNTTYGGGGGSGTTVNGSNGFASGGGRSAIRRINIELATAGAGGGGGAHNCGPFAGNGGGLTGGTPTPIACFSYSLPVLATGGTQTAGGAAGTCGIASYNGFPGSAFAGGRGGNQVGCSLNAGGGGGGGYYGGGGGSCHNDICPATSFQDDGMGAGGSSYIGGLTNAVNNQGSNTAAGGNTDIHYQAGIGFRNKDTNGLVNAGHGYIFLQWNEALPTNTTSTAAICINQTKALTGTPAGGFWSIVNGGGSIIDTNYTPTSSGNKTIRYSVNGCSKEVTFTVNALPTIGGVTSVCVGSSANVTPSTDGTWISSNPAVASVTNSGEITGLGTGSVSIIFMQIATGCSNTRTINVNPIPAAPIVGPITQPKCNAMGNVLLSGLPIGNWVITSNPAGLNATGNTPSTTISGLSTNTKYTFSVKDSNSCISQSSANVVIGVISNPPQNRTLDLGPNVSICRADSHRINLQTLAGDMVKWNDGNTEAIRTIINPGTYSVSITTAEECVLSDSIIISRSYDKIPKDSTIALCESKTYIYKGENYNAGQTIIDSLNATKGCDTFLTIRLRAIPGPIIHKDTTTCHNTPIKLNKKTFQVGDTINYINKSASGCDTLIKMIYRLNPNELKVTMVMEIKGSIGQTISVAYKSTGGIIDNIIFNPKSDIDRKADSIIVSIKANRTYSITFANEHGCSVTKNLTIDVDLEPLLPNIVTLQSNNPENALFYLKTEGVTYDMFIYDRWGNLIYNSPKSIGGDVSKAWHPQKLKVVSGVYVFLVSLYTDKGIVQYSGTVTVL